MAAAGFMSAAIRRLAARPQGATIAEVARLCECEAPVAAARLGQMVRRGPLRREPGTPVRFFFKDDMKLSNTYAALTTRNASLGDQVRRQDKDAPLCDAARDKLSAADKARNKRMVEASAALAGLWGERVV